MLRANSLSLITLLLAGCMSSPISERPAGVYTLLDPATGVTYNVPLRYNLTAGLPRALASAGRSYVAQATDAVLFGTNERVGATETASPVVVASVATVSIAAPVELPQAATVAVQSASVEGSAKTDVQPVVVTAALRDAPPFLNLKLDTEFASAKRLVRFAVGLSSLGPIGKLAVAELVPWAKQAEKVFVRGGADSSGNARRNRELALARARAVSSAFMAAGVHPQKITERFCSNCYVASNDTERGRRINRRVEVELVLQKELFAKLPGPVYALEAPTAMPLIQPTAFRPQVH
jgi:outer membrane protein OmpA-like peptidoglycan-associated protein